MRLAIIKEDMAICLRMALNLSHAGTFYELHSFPILYSVKL